MRMRRLLLSVAAAGLVTLAAAGSAEAQVILTTPAPVVSYYTPATSYYVPAPAVSYQTYYTPSVSYYSAPAVTYYQPATVPSVSYYTGATSMVVPATVPATVHRGLLGRTVVRYPGTTIRYW